MESLQSLNPNRSRKALTVLKAIISLFLLPWVYSLSTAFVAEVSTVEARYVHLFVSGVVTCASLYLFIYEPTRLFQMGQRLTEAIFRFLSPLVKIASFVLPIYSIIVFIACILTSLFNKSTVLFGFFIFLIGLTITFHLIFSARILRSRKEDFLMINYLFSFGLVYVINISLLALGFSVLFRSFSWINFCRTSFQISRGIFFAVFNQLFL